MLLRRLVLEDLDDVGVAAIGDVVADSDDADSQALRFVLEPKAMVRAAARQTVEPLNEQHVEVVPRPLVVE